MPIHSEIIPALKTRPGMDVTWEWYDKKGGVVKWIVENKSSITLSGILVRGVLQNKSIHETYPFGNAFFPVYYHDFSEIFNKTPSPLKNTGVKSNAPNLGIFSFKKERFAAFLFTLSAGENYEMLEGGFIDNTEPAAEKMVLADYIKTTSFEISYKEEQCKGYDKQTNTNYKCPENPFKATSSLWELSSEVKPLFADKIVFSGESCKNIFENAIVAGNNNEMLRALMCMYENQ